LAQALILLGTGPKLCGFTQWLTGALNFDGIAGTTAWFLAVSMIYNTAYLISEASEPDFGRTIEALNTQFEEHLRIQ
jgi:hypothetical protein